MDEESASNGSIFRNFEGEEMMGKVILFAIVSLFTAILFLLLLHLYARLFWWRVERHLNLNLTQPGSPGSTVIGRNNQRRRFVFAQGQEDPPRNTGLDSTTLHENLSERIEEDEESKSPVFTRLRSLKKLLSREKKGVACIPGSSSTNINNV
ncbi:unnamed protein product [Eruca vesicaria subsp. sativa]|uniref:Uncharacterized protein n=1 Tax=Eruca vesicaria subsp. sativa TaxID=29727 RepID=A0ABC8K4M0_ERUVS|nr:unnamed protein product [Eruca vesicaria subsp. sativa]